MTKKILLIHSSVDGHTVKILDKISSLIGEKRSVTKKCISEAVSYTHLRAHETG